MGTAAEWAVAGRTRILAFRFPLNAPPPDRSVLAQSAAADRL
jgi:hypothetical protein